ncbi:choice-of-anchor I family protein [Planococcus shenhongbingii]|uniref:Choice-of-anchor I family protein n=1 Tax=Planococcus shenhongbingii TaxID=3058398 RepID=A0ABT8N9Q0_9BACL|nr:choice-of-anchor I family protein [Planococcus sp. N017]MDN7244607.1 choice-of-anchor I family protein [Planococcus sp. N017]
MKKDSTADIPLLKRVPLSDFGVEASDLTSVAIHPGGGYIAVSVPAADKTDDGHIVFMSIDGEPLSNVRVGALPDMLAFTPDGSQLLVANEGEPSDDYTVNPEGSVSIIDVTSSIEDINERHVTTAAFSENIIEDGVRKVHPESTYAEDLEPEYITVDKDGKYAYVALQENNAIAKLDLETKKFISVQSLGFKDFSAQNNKLDASNEDDAIDIRNWPVLSMFQPDGITTFESGGNSYILSANEGDVQDWKGFSEETRVADLAGDYQLNADLYKGYNQNQLDRLVKNGLFEENQLGRLTTSISQPKNDQGKYEAIYGIGGRSFSVWHAKSMELAYDSGDDFEQITAKVYPDYFNSTNDEDKLDNRSDDKGPEPESVITGEVDGTPYAFIGLERQGGIMVYDLTKPTKPKFSTYFSSRVFNGGDVTTESGDVAPEGLTFIPATESPTGQELLLAAHEVSGTIAAYSLGDDSKRDKLPENAKAKGKAFE